LKRNDDILSRIIDGVGSFRIQLRLPPFTGLVQAIISQQLGEAAARAIYSRFIQLYPNRNPLPSFVNNTSLQQITNQGLSMKKASLIKELASDIVFDNLSLDRLARASNGNVIERLLRYNGIGEWTANIFLIFSLGRIDALPKSDLALQRAIAKAYGTPSNNDWPSIFDRITSNWKPYRTIACWY